MHPKQYASTEEQRKREESLANEQRFFDYNTRRVNRGMRPLKYYDYLSRKHGKSFAEEAVRRVNQRQAHPVNRDNIVLFNR